MQAVQLVAKPRIFIKYLIILQKLQFLQQQNVTARNAGVL